MKSIAGYNVVKLLAKGGMAAIYLAEQQSLQRQVVLKFLNPKLDDAVKQRFIDEGRIIASLKHPNIITVFDVVSTEKFNFLAMEYLPDGDLETRLLNKLDTFTVLNIISKISDALHLIHKQGIIHGDIKPGNILFRGADCPLLTDFGISHRIEPKKEVDMNPDELYASPRYASPELIQGKPFDYRTDIYSLGIMLYEMLIGEKPFTADTELQSIANSIQNPVPKLPEPLHELQPLLESLLAKSPEKRLSDAKLATRFIVKYLKDHPNLTPTSDTKLIDTDVVVEYLSRNRQIKFNLFNNKYFGISVLIIFILAVFWFNKDTIREDHLTTAPQISTAQVVDKQSMDNTALSRAKQDLVTQNNLLEQKNNELAQIKNKLEEQKNNKLAQIRNKLEEQKNLGHEKVLMQQQTISDLIKKGKSSLRNYKLTTPVKNNAYYYFQKVLELDNNNSAAKAGIADVVSHYEILARSELKKFQYQKAQSFISTGLTIDPKNEDLLALQKQANLKNEPKRVINKVKSFFRNL